MDLKEVMDQETFVVVGNTLRGEKYACKIKDRLDANGYTTYGVHQELGSINDVDGDIDIIDLCINPVKGLEYMKENKKPVKCVVIQPGAESRELIQYLKDENIDYLEGCLLVGMSLFPRKKD